MNDKKRHISIAFRNSFVFLLMLSLPALYFTIGTIVKNEVTLNKDTVGNYYYPTYYWDSNETLVFEDKALDVNVELGFPHTITIFITIALILVAIIVWYMTWKIEIN